MNVVSIEENKNNIIKKNISIVLFSRYHLSEHSLKLISMLISMINVKDVDFKEYVIKGKDFKELIGTKSNDYTNELKMISKELLSADITIDKDNSVFITKWVISAEYEKGGGYLKLMIHPYLKPYLLNLKSNFMQYNIINILRLKSNYVIRLYELFKLKFSEYKYYNPKATSFKFELKIEWLRTHFEIPKSYQYSSHIKKLIIEKAKKEFKEKTDIYFSYKEIKLGRKVDRLIITVIENSKGSNDYLSNKKAFISYVRENFVNVDLLKGRDKHNNKDMTISIAPDGTLYNKTSTTQIDPKRADEIWDILYNMELNGTLNLKKLL